MKRLLLFLLIIVAGACKNGSLTPGDNTASSRVRAASVTAGNSADREKVKTLFIVKVAGKYGYMDRNGRLVITPQFDSADNFAEGLAAICFGKCDFFAANPNPGESKYGFIDEKGQIVVNPQYDEAVSFSEGLASVCSGSCGANSTGERKWGFINPKGEVVIPLQFGEVYSFHDGLAAACIGACVGIYEKPTGKWGYIDHSGKFVINPQFDDVDNFDSQLARVSVGHGDQRKQGYLEQSGKVVWTPSN